MHSSFAALQLYCWLACLFCGVPATAQAIELCGHAWRLHARFEPDVQVPSQEHEHVKLTSASPCWLRAR